MRAIALGVHVLDVQTWTPRAAANAFSAGYLRVLSLGRSGAEAARLGCATAAQVAQGLGTDRGDFDLAAGRGVQPGEPRRVTRVYNPL